MKKGLSVLLIAAALFGFYGGAVNLNDILACKDYWEEAGEKSTADMNKLEDGLNQLKDNEQAYLDGLDQVEEGEAALAEGEATLAKGEADYAAAPGKLRAGEKQLAEGEDSYADLQRLIKGLKTARKHGVESTKTHDTYWHDAFSQSLKPGKAQIIGGLKQARDQGVLGLLEGLTDTSELDSKAANAKSYSAFDEVVAKQLVPTFEGAAAALNQFATLAGSKATELDNAKTLHSKIVGFEDGWSTLTSMVGYDGAMNAENELDFVTTYADAIKAATGGAKDLSPLKPYLENIVQNAGAYKTYFPASRFVKKGVADQLTEFLKTYGATLEGVAAGNADFAALVQGFKDLAAYNIQSDNISGAVFEGTITQLVAGLNTKAVPALVAYAKSAQDNADLFKKWDAGYKTLAAAKDGKDKNDLASKSEGIPFAFNSMLTNKTLKSALKKYDKKLIKELKKYKGDRLINDDMQEFDDDLTYICNKLIPRSLKVLAKVKADAAKQLAAGRKQLAQGRKDYAEAPAKLAEGRQQLADGRAQLAAGKDQLAQYEDGEQQVRDGLATLVGTEPDLELESILDRLNGDSDFDNGDEHLDLDEGLAAVEVGRGYQAEDGELITKEIMTRAIGTGGLLAAGVLAVLAALLSFMKKNKGAGVCAILAAAAGAFGAFEATQAGTYFSNIAGSTVGQTGLYAAGALAVVALVHAIAHFTAKKEA